MRILKLALVTLLIVPGLSDGSLLAQSRQSAAQMAGNWLGVLSAGGNLKLRLLLKINAAPDGSLTAVMDSLDQPDSNNLKVDSISFQNGVLHFEMKARRIVYEGSLRREGEIVGLFTLSGSSRLIFRKEGVPRST